MSCRVPLCYGALNILRILTRFFSGLRRRADSTPLAIAHVAAAVCALVCVCVCLFVCPSSLGSARARMQWVFFVLSSLLSALFLDFWPPHGCSWPCLRS